MTYGIIKACDISQGLKSVTLYSSINFIVWGTSIKPLSLYFIMVDFEIYSLISYVYKCILESTYTYGMYNILWKKQ